MKSRTAVMEGIRQMSVREFDVPEPQNDEVLVKVYQCNICTTDWQTWAGLRGSQGRTFPWAPGHEQAGEIVALGPDAREDLKVGDRVAFGSDGGCGQCEFCRAGIIPRCTGRRARGNTIDGVVGSFGMAQYVLSRSSRIYKLADDLSYEEGGYLEPLASAIRGQRRLRVGYNDDVLIIGAGNLGLVHAQLARVLGGHVMVSELQPQRIELAKSMGFATVNPGEENVVEATKEFSGGKGMDAIVLAVGATSANQQALEVVAPAGRILFYAAGYPHPEIKVEPNAIHYLEYELIGTMGCDPTDFEWSASMLSRRQVKVDKLISQKIPLDDVQKAFELASTPGTYRVSLSFWS